MCTYPRKIKNSKGEFIVPCGHCYQCLQQRRNMWTFRNLVEFYFSKSAYFLTLTYSDIGIQRLPLCPDTFIRLADKSHYQKFLKRIRKEYAPVTLRYFGCHEYGKKYFRPHYHIILYFSDNIKLKTSDVQQFWPYGYVTVDMLNQARIHYCSKYLQKPFRFEYFIGTPAMWIEEEETKNDISSAFNKLVRYTYRRNTFNFMSRRPGIGAQMLNPDFVKYVRDNSIDNYAQVYFMGRKYPLPKYFKDKIFSEDEKLLIYPNIRQRLDEIDESERKYFKLTRKQIFHNRHIQNLKRQSMVNMVSKGEFF